MELDLLVNTMCSAGYYALLALAIVFTYRTHRVLLFCVGEMGALSAFVAYSLQERAGPEVGIASTSITLAVTLILAGAVGAGLCWIIERLGAKGGHFVGTMMTIAFSLSLQGVMNTVWKGEIYRYPLMPDLLEVGGAQVPVLSIAVAVIALGVSGLLVVLLNRSRIGYEMQALADNRVLSTLRGIPVQRRVIGVGALAGVLAGLGGLLAASVTSVSLENSALGVNAIVAAIIGGLTSPLGAIAGALVLALVEALTATYLDSRYITLMPIVLLGVFLVFRPYGLGGKAERIQRV